MSIVSKRYNNPETEKLVLELLASENPASVGWIAEKLDCCWSTAKILLLDMARRGLLEKKETSIGYFFTIPKKANTVLSSVTRVTKEAE